ncbi:MAG: V-type ATPase subunit [Candidatus Diapherotrites archaeon]
MELVILGALGAAGAAMGGMAYYIYRSIGPVMPFLYADARIQARSNYLLSETKLQAMADARSLSEVANHVQETDYFEHVGKAANLREFHAGAEKGFLDSVDELKKMSPENTHELFDAYLMFWEAKMVKAIYRAKKTGQEEFLSGEKGVLIPVGEFTEGMLARAVEARTIADIAVVLQDRPYFKIVEQEYGNVEQFEVALDSNVLEHFAQVVKKTKIYDGKIITELLNTKFDIMNLLALIKMVSRGTEKGEREKMLIKNNTKLAERFAGLCKSETLQELVQGLEGLHYYEPMNEQLAVYEKEHSLSAFEIGLWKFYRTLVEKSAIEFGQGPYPIFAYLAKKELELRNLLIVSKGVDAKMDVKETMEMTV